MRTLTHGEVILMKVKKLPEGLKKVKAKKGSYLLADSETSGNFHLLEEKAGVELYEKDGVLYCKNEVPVDVFCAHKDRHDNITLEPGVWEIDLAQEYDHLNDMTRKVAD